MDEEEKVLPNLPGCLLVDICSRLPVKSLCRFKCVSKFFLSFIQDPYLVDQIRPKTTILVQVRVNNVLYVYSIDCCGGLATLKHVCKFDTRISHFRYYDGLNCCFSSNLELVVCNLTTNERVTLPTGCGNCILCFDPSAHKYKLLGRVEKDDGLPLDLQVLTLERNPSWRPVPNTLKMFLMLEPDVVVSGRPFWLVVPKRRILSFNPANEGFGVIDLPDEVNVQSSWCCVFEFEGFLCLVEQHTRATPTFNLWILKDGAWILMRKNVTLPFEAANLHKYYSRLGVECWRAHGFNFSSRPGEMLVVVDGDFDCHFMFVYSVLNNQFKTIKVTGLHFHNFTKRNYIGNGYQMRYFVENYLSLQELVGDDDRS